MPRPLWRVVPWHHFGRRRFVSPYAKKLKGLPRQAQSGIVFSSTDSLRILSLARGIPQGLEKPWYTFG